MATGQAPPLTNSFFPHVLSNFTLLMLSIEVLGEI